jgi:DNA modification methylase
VFNLAGWTSLKYSRCTLILDPFAGSGSTLAAAAKTGRQYIGIEIDEQYSKLAATRAAEHHQKGETT